MVSKLLKYQFLLCKAKRGACPPSLFFGGGRGEKFSLAFKSIVLNGLKIQKSVSTPNIMAITEISVFTL